VSDAETTEDGADEEPRGGSLAPLYSRTDIVPGVQAVRRGNMILYSVRGEPAVVQELIGRLNREGIKEIVAFISHRVVEEKDEQ